MILFNYYLLNTIGLILFYFTFLIITSKQIIVSLLFLIVTYLSISLILMFLGFEFLGFMLIIVYIGAIAMLFLFVLMLFNISPLTSFYYTKLIIFKLYLFIISVTLIFQYYYFKFFYSSIFFNNFNLQLNSFISYNLYDLAINLYSKQYFLYVIIIGILLLLALIGALFLTAKEEFNQYTLRNF